MEPWLAVLRTLGPRVAASASRHAARLWPVICLVLLVPALYRDVLGRWWMGDDTQVMVHAARFPSLDYFLRPEAWQPLSPANLTPWVVLSFDLDLRLAGLNPYWFYLHQLASLVLVAIATFVLLRMWLDRWWSFAGATLFLVGPGPAEAAGQLVLRHYVEGLLFAILALCFYLRSLRRAAARWAWLGAAFYLLATTAKEIYVPLPIILPFLAEGRVRARLMACLPFALVAGLYGLWRWHMLGVAIGGYSHLSAVTWSTVLDLPAGALQAFFGTSAVGRAACVTALLIIVYLAWALKARAVWFIPAAVLLMAPLIPVALLLEGGELRFLIFSWWAVSVAVASGSHGSRQVRLAQRLPRWSQ